MILRDVKIKKRIDTISIVYELEKNEEVNSQELDVISKGVISGLVAPNVTSGFANKKSLSFDIFNCTPMEELIGNNFTFYQFVQILQDAVRVLAECHNKGIRVSNIEKDKSLLFYDISSKRVTMLFWPLVESKKEDHDNDERALLLSLTALFDTQDADRRFKVYFEDYLRKKDYFDLMECTYTLSALKRRWLEQAELPPSEEETVEFAKIPSEIMAGTDILTSSASWYMRSGQGKKKTETDYYKAGAPSVTPSVISEKEEAVVEEDEEEWFYDEKAEKRSKRRFLLVILLASILSITAGITLAKVLAHKKHNNVPVSPAVKVEETESEGATEETEAATTESAGLQVEVYIGKKLSEISAALEQSGIKIISSMVFSDTEEEDVIIKQSVKPGIVLHAGDEISFVVSQGKEAADVKTITVPSVVGKTEAEAISLLKGLGLNPLVRRNHHESVKEGLVFTQWVSEGSEVEEGATIGFIVSLGPEESLEGGDGEVESGKQPNESVSETTKPAQSSDRGDTTEKETKETVKPTEKETMKPTEKETEKPTEKETEKPAEKETEKPTEKETEKETEKPKEDVTESSPEKETAEAMEADKNKDKNKDKDKNKPGKGNESSETDSSEGGNSRKVPANIVGESDNGSIDSGNVDGVDNP